MSSYGKGAGPNGEHLVQGRGEITEATQIISGWVPLLYMLQGLIMSMKINNIERVSAKELTFRAKSRSYLNMLDLI